jgi:hypothetical protein
MPKPQPSEWIRLLVENAAKLRDAGVRCVKLEGCEVSFAEPEAKPLQIETEPDISEEDPLNDPATFGRRDGRVPGFRREDA